MTHPYKPTIFALNTRKLDVLPDPKRSGTLHRSPAPGHFASLVRDGSADGLKAD
jgi:hypothetical protein